MTHCRQLKFEEAPDYTKYKKLFKDLFFRCGFEHEYIFDWTIQRYRVDKPSTSSNDGGADEKNSKLLLHQYLCVFRLDHKTSTYQESLKNQVASQDDLNEEQKAQITP